MSRVPLRLLLCLTCYGLVAGADATAGMLNQATETFERSMQQHFVPVRDRLELFRRQYHFGQSAKIDAAIKTGSEADRKFLAYHLLTVFSRHKTAQVVYGADEAQRPIALDGSRNPAVAVPQPDDPAALTLVRNFRYPPFAAVRQEVLAASKSFNSRGKLRAQSTFYVQLQKMCETHPKLAGPVMAFYFPTAKEAKGQPAPASVYLNPLDRYLLDEGLSAIEWDRNEPARGVKPQVDEHAIRFAKDGIWRFPLLLANCRIEALIDRSSMLDLTLAARGGRAVTLAWRDGTGTATIDGVTAACALPAGVTGGLLELEVRGPILQVQLNGLVLAESTATTPLALSEVQIRGGTQAAHLCVRYLGERQQPQNVIATLPPPDTAWHKDLVTTLAKPITVSFQDQQLGAVVEALGTIAKVAFVVDPSAKALMDVPLNFSAEEMKLSDVLVWMKRMTDIDHYLSEQGIVLEWRAAR